MAREPRDVWVGSAVSDDPPSAGAGLGANQAFSVDVVFGLGFALLKEHPLVVLTAGFAIVVLQVGGQLVQQVLGPIAGDDPATQVAVGLISMVIGLFSALAIFWVMAGLFGETEIAARGGTPSVPGLLFTPRVWNALFATILAQLALLVPALLLIAPGLGAIVWAVMRLVEEPGDSTAALVLAIGVVWTVIVALGIGWLGLFAALVTPAAVLSGGGPVDALGAAWEAASGARLTLLVLTIVFGFAQILACCLGVFGLIPLHGIYIGGLGLAWLLYARPREETQKWPFFERNASHLF